MFRSFILTCPVLALMILVSNVSEARAERTSWNNFRHYKQDSQMYVQFIKRGNVWLEYQNNKQMHSFQENNRAFNWIELYDSSRQLFVRLWNDRCDVWIVKRQPKWVTYYRGGWHATRFHVTFEKMYVHDDKEAGSGDWQVRASITGTIEGRSLIGKKEAGTGQAVLINHSFVVSRKQFDVSCQVHEYDGGFGAGWDNVGKRTLRVDTSGKYQIRIRGSEGDVSINLNVTAVD